jgi:hypothetical protein
MNHGPQAHETAVVDMAVSITHRLRCIIEKMETADAEVGWWKSYDMIWKGVPQMCLQLYVLLTTRDLTFINVTSICLSVLGVAWAYTAIYNNAKLGEKYWSIVAVDALSPALGLFMYCLGSIGLRALVLSAILVIKPAAAVMYGAALFLSNQLATYIFIYSPLRGDGEVMVTHTLDEFGYQLVMRNKASFYSFVVMGSIGGYGFLNLLIAGPGLVLRGWRYQLRRTCVVANVTWRFLECLCGVLLIQLLEAVDECESSSVGYVACGGCCRGPVHRNLCAYLSGLFAAMYIVGFAVWWPNQSRYLLHAPEWTAQRQSATALPSEPV